MFYFTLYALIVAYENNMLSGFTWLGMHLYSKQTSTGVQNSLSKTLYLCTFRTCS